MDYKNVTWEPFPKKRSTLLMLNFINNFKVWILDVPSYYAVGQ